MTKTIVLTFHASVRAKERLGVLARDLMSAACQAYAEGLTCADLSGSFLRYAQRYEGDLRVWNGGVWIFRPHCRFPERIVLVSCWEVPGEYWATARRLLQERNGKVANG